MAVTARIGARRMRCLPRASPITGGKILEAVAISHLIPILGYDRENQPECGEKKTDEAKHDASDGHSLASVALRIGANLDQTDDRKNQAENVERHAVATATGNEHGKNSQYHSGNRHPVVGWGKGG